MKQPFTALTKKDVEKLRRLTAAGSTQYNFSKNDIDKAVKQLETIYTGRVERKFATSILLLSELY